MESKQFMPNIKWAQRTDAVFLTVEVRDLKNENIVITDTSLVFDGESDDKKYHFTLEFFDEINKEVIQSTFRRPSGARLDSQSGSTSSRKSPSQNIGPDSSRTPKRTNTSTSIGTSTSTRTPKRKRAKRGSVIGIPA